MFSQNWSPQYKWWFLGVPLSKGSQLLGQRGPPYWETKVCAWSTGKHLIEQYQITIRRFMYQIGYFKFCLCLYIFYTIYRVSKQEMVNISDFASVGQGCTLFAKVIMLCFIGKMLNCNSLFSVHVYKWILVFLLGLCPPLETQWFQWNWSAEI